MGKSIHEPSKEYAAKNNINIVSIEEFPPATVDLTTEVLRLEGKGSRICLHADPSGWHYHGPESLLIVTTITCLSLEPGPPQTQISLNLGQGLIRNRLFMQFCGVLPQDKTPGESKLLWRNCGRGIRQWISSKPLTGKVWLLP